MPLINPVIIEENLDNLQEIEASIEKTTSPQKFFSSKLTGRGTKQGLFNTSTNHINLLNTTKQKWFTTNGAPSEYRYNRYDAPFHPRKENVTGDFESYFLPLDLTSYSQLLSASSRYTLRHTDIVIDIDDTTKYADIDSWFKLYENNDFAIHIRVIPTSISIFTKNIDVNNGYGGTTKGSTKVPSVYFIQEIAIKNKTTNGNPTLNHKVRITKNISNFRDEITVETTGLLESIDKNISYQLESTLISAGVPKSDIATINQDYNKYIENAEVHDLVNYIANIQFKDTESILSNFLKNMIAFAKSHNINPDDITVTISQWIRMIDSAQGYNDKKLLPNTTLETLSQILNNESTYIGKKNTESIFNQSLRLLLAKRLKELRDLKDNGSLYEFIPTDSDVTEAFENSPDYSAQQKAIILSTSPLIIGAAGAGSGKSHTVTGRLSYLEQQGIDLSHVGVFSFTNIAADNISERYPGIRSETLANMFNEIYAMNYPVQQLSQPTTVSNSIKMLDADSPIFAAYPDKDEVRTFMHHFSKNVEEFDQQGFKWVDLQTAYRNLNELLRDYPELTETTLNAIEQTTLELEPAILHLHLNNNWNKIKIPEKYQNLDFIITDESQDISTFEYIILLELAIHYKAQLLIVGDGSQTLYEFRNSDPRYINALEGSGIFESKKLDVNYRSKQDILDYANQFLDVIDANKIANIQLSANSFTKPTLTSFNEAITIRNMEMFSRKGNDYIIALKDYILKDKKTISWILEKLNNNEQIAFLSWTRAEIDAIQKAIAELLKRNNITGKSECVLLRDKQDTYTLMSKLLVKVKDRLTSLPFDHTHNNKLETMFVNANNRKHYNDPQKQFNHEMAIRYSIREITQTPQYSAIINDVNTGKMSKDEWRGIFAKMLIDNEIKKNSVKTYLDGVNANMEEAKTSDIVYSTIHSAKGLEFDNVFLTYNNEKKSSHSQESFRLYFVGLSRAKNSELIINAYVSRSYSYYTNVSNSDSRSGMFIDPINVAFRRCTENIKKSTISSPVSDDEE